MSTPVLDVAIGLSLLFLFVSLLVTIVQESLTGWLGLRAKNLYDALENLLGKDQVTTGPKGDKVQTLVDAVYDHPQVKSLYRSAKAWEKGTLQKKSYLPSYVPSRVFAIALLDVLRGTKTASEAVGINNLLAGAKQLVSELPEGLGVKQPLALLVADVETFSGGLNDKAEAVSARIEEWFNDSMARASGWYKRQAQLLSFVIGIGAAVFLNADALDCGMRLWTDSNLRAQVVAAASSVAAADQTHPQLASVMSDLRASTLPVGWVELKWPGPRKMLGWLVTGFAASLGAPFWFDLLNKALKLRGSGVPISARSGAPAQKKGEPQLTAPPP